MYEFIGKVATFWIICGLVAFISDWGMSNSKLMKLTSKVQVLSQFVSQVCLGPISLLAMLVRKDDA